MAGMLVIAKGVVHTGVVTRVTWRLLKTVDTARQAFLQARGSDRSAVGADQHHADRRDAHPRCPRAPADPQRSRPRAAAAHHPRHDPGRLGDAHRHQLEPDHRGAGSAAGRRDDHAVVRSGGPAGGTGRLGRCSLSRDHGCCAARRRPASARSTGAWSFPWLRARSPWAGSRRPSAWIAPRSTTCRRSSAGDASSSPSTRSRPVTSWCTRRPSVGCAPCGRSPRFGLAPQKLYLASVAEGDFGMLIDLEQEGDLKMVAAQTDKPIRDTPAAPGATCFVTTDSAESLAQHSELALWRDVVGRAPQPHKTRVALSILAAVIVVRVLRPSGRGARRVHRRGPDGAHRRAHSTVGRPCPRLERAVRAGRVDRPGRHRA